MKPLRIAMTLLITIAAAGAALAADTDGRGTLERAVEHYAGLDAYAAEMVIDLVLPAELAAMAGGMEPSRYAAVAAGDGRVAFRSRGGMITDPFVQDAERWYLEIGFLKAYVLLDAVPRNRLLDEDDERAVPLLGAAQFLSFASRAGDPGSLLDAETVVDAGVEDVDGLACRRLELSGDAATEVWIAEGDAPWITRIKMAPPAPAPGDDGMMMITPGLDIVYSAWDGSPDLDGAFDIEINEAYARRDAMPGPEDFGGEGAPPGGDHDSIGKPAPALELATLDGGAMNLADLKGKVVVLDFWAVWCKPCLMALPGVIEVTSELADRGVAFWSVNQGDTKAKIEALIAEKGWDLPVALDAGGKAGAAYGVQGIPHTVIIDKQGVVRHVHSGFAPGMDAMLKKEIEALLGE